MNEIKKLNVIKVPNEIQEETIVETKPFPRMPRMYLELLENKDKVKPDLLNRDYDPNDAESVISFYSSKDEPQIKEKPMEVIKEQSDIEEEDSDLSEDESLISSKSMIEDNSTVSSSKSIEEEEEDEQSTYSDMKPPSERVIEDTKSEKESERSFLSEKDEKKTMLKQMLREETEKRPSPPRLSDLQRDGMLKSNRVIPNLDYLEEEQPEDEEDKKRELLFKFELLKKSYKNVDIPEFSIHSSLKKMNETYENQLRHLTLDSSVENYKNILVGGFMVFEFIFGVWLKFDMSGFTQQQILNMNQYERLLIELGQKSYVPEGQQWPVEFRLVGLIILNAVIFIISKLILKKTGSNLMGMMNHIQKPVTKTTEPSAPKKKMKGPTINLDDLED